MGHKFSTVHGVKSEDYFKPGNAINEIWFGDVEIISRLPFGDSDLAQSAWPVGGWPKIPWHNFLIPWKRSIAGPEGGSSEVGAGEEGRGGGVDGMEAAGIGILGRPLSKTELLGTSISLSLIAFVAFYVPVRLRNTAPRFRGLSGIEESGGQARRLKRGYMIRGWLGTFSLFLGTAVEVLGFYAVGRMQRLRDGTLLIVLDMLWALAATVGCIYSANAVWSIWRDWVRARRWEALEVSCGSSPNPLLDQELPKAVVSWLERVRRP